jgi:hypothetical protein
MVSPSDLASSATSPLCHAWGREQGPRGVALTSPASTWWMAFVGFAHPGGALFRDDMA